MSENVAFFCFSGYVAGSPVLAKAGKKEVAMRIFLFTINARHVIIAVYNLLLGYRKD